MAAEIVAPITEPETEWVRGRLLQKVSPTRTHALLQYAMASALKAWIGAAGEVGTEWRFRISPPGKPSRPLVPDIACVAKARLLGLSGDDLEVPRFSPDVAVEILSQGDRRPDVDDKIATYLAAGSSLVIVVDPRSQRIELHDRGSRSVVRAGERLTHARLPGFELDVTALFATVAPP